MCLEYKSEWGDKQKEARMIKAGKARVCQIIQESIKDLVIYLICDRELWLTFWEVIQIWKFAFVSLPVRCHWTEEPGRLYSPWGPKESDMTKWLHFHFSPGKWWKCLLISPGNVFGLNKCFLECVTAHILAVCVLHNFNFNAHFRKKIPRPWAGNVTDNIT